MKHFNFSYIEYSNENIFIMVHIGKLLYREGIYMQEVKSLKIGNTIGILAPAGPARSNLEIIKKSIESYGYNVKIGESCYLSYKGYLAGPDKIRAKELENMFLDDEIDAIMCLRGGYGTTRILDLIDYEIIKSNPKIFIGFSDITALHIVFNQRCNLGTYHGLMAQSSPEWDDFSYISLINALNFKNKLKINNPQDKNIYTLKEGVARGKIVGGNLSLIVASLGTKYEIDTKDKILFIEEVGEYTYRIDRMLTHLHHAGKFDDCCGIIFGDFKDCRKSNDDDATIDKLLDEISKKCNKPSIYNLKSGHCMPMVTLPLGLECYMNASTKEIQIVK